MPLGRPVRKDRVILAPAPVPVPVPVHASVAAHHRQHQHRRGCNTDRCDRIADGLWLKHWLRAHPRPTGSETIASWYDDSGATACRKFAGAGVANKTLPCGTKVRICYGRSCETAVVEDRGPFIPGRELDLDPEAKAGIGCSDLCPVIWTVAR